MAPVVVVLAIWALTGVAPRARFLAALVAALTGAILVIGAHRDEHRALLGDACASASAVFYAVYQIVLQKARQHVATLPLMAWVGVAATIVLLPFAWLEGDLLPHTAMAWIWLICLALLVQLGGQVVIAHAIKHIDPARASVALLVQPATAAFYAWGLLGERLDAMQMVGGLLVLIGIYRAQR